MKHTVITLLVALIPSTAFAGLDAPDLCADVYLGEDGAPLTDTQGRVVPRFCEPTGPNPPVWNDEVCCTFDTDGATCSATDVLGRCSVGATMWCDFGEHTGGEVTCYHPFPDTCELGYCVDAPPDVDPIEAEPVEDEALCCIGTNICFGHDNPFGGCEGEIGVCTFGETNEDGTVTCHDS